MSLSSEAGRQAGKGARSTGDGLCLLAKRLDRGRFVWPQAEDGKVFLTQAQLSMLLEAIDWRQPKRIPFNQSIL